MNIVRFFLLGAMALILLAVLAPYPVHQGPIGWFYAWEGLPFVQHPFAGQFAPWLRLAIYIFGFLAMLRIRGDGQRTRALLLISAATITLMSLVSSSPKE